MSDIAVISCALTGALTTRAQCPAIPYTPAEIGEEARRAADAGAAIVHIHARNDDGTPTWAPGTFRRIFEEVRSRTDVIINLSTGSVGIPAAERVQHIRDLKPEVAALNMGSMNYAIYSSKRKEFYHDHVFANPFHDIRFFLEAMNEAGVRPEMECFDSGHIGNTRPLIDLACSGPRTSSASSWASSAASRQAPGTSSTRSTRCRRVALAGDRRRPRAVAPGARPRCDGRQPQRRPGGQLSTSRRAGWRRQRRAGREGGADLPRPGRECRVHRRGPGCSACLPKPEATQRVTEIKAELVGNVWKIVAGPGDKVEEDDVLLILESMKMEIPVVAPHAGTVKEIRVKETEVVKEGQVLAVVE